MVRLNGLLDMAHVFQVDRTSLFGVIEIQGCHHLSLAFCVICGVLPHAVQLQTVNSDPLRVMLTVLELVRGGFDISVEGQLIVSLTLIYLLLVFLDVGFVLLFFFQELGFGDVFGTRAVLGGCSRMGALRGDSAIQ